MLFLINPLFLISLCQRRVELHAVLRTEVIVWDRFGSPLVNILFMTRLLILFPLFLEIWIVSWPCDHYYLLFPWLQLLYIWFSDLYHCQKKFLVLQPIYTHRKIIKAPLLHQSLGPRVFIYFFLSLPPALSFTFLSLTPDCQVPVH